MCFSSHANHGATHTPTHLVAKTGVAASDVAFVAWTYGETHMSVESRRAQLASTGGTRW
jgi:hypothetical protein